MIQEAYVSHEVAKLLKEKGFNELCQKEYYANGFLIDCGKNYDIYSNSQLGENEYSAPTQQMVMRWLREVHNINININWNPTSKDYFVEIFKPTLLYSTITFNSYEQACEEGIKYCLTNLNNEND